MSRVLCGVFCWVIGFGCSNPGPTTPETDPEVIKRAEEQARQVGKEEGRQTPAQK
jgi:hypothetical protein